MAAAMRAKSSAVTRRKPNRNAAPQCALLRTNESASDQRLDRRGRRGQKTHAAAKRREILADADLEDRAVATRRWP
jgi:hypothetical protein